MGQPKLETAFSVADVCGFFFSIAHLTAWHLRARSFHADMMFFGFTLPVVIAVGVLAGAVASIATPIAA